MGEARSRYCSRSCCAAGFTIQVQEQEVAEALKIYESGKTWKEVEKVMGISRTHRNRIVKFLKSGAKFESRPGKKINQTGVKNDNWKGGRTRLSGYVAIKAEDHPRGRGGNRGYVMEHILVIEKHIGRYLVWQGRQHPDNEIVHHINGIRDDNRFENLVLMLSREHSHLHINQKWAREILDSTNNIIYSNLEQASAAAGVNETELATCIHFRWTHNGILWKYAMSEPVTGRILES
jgi:hypothetical protein